MTGTGKQPCRCPRSFPAGRAADDRAQASVEAVAGIVALILTGLLCLQLLVAGYAMTVADGAAEAGGIALVRGDPVETAVRQALPGWARSRVTVVRMADSVRVRLRPPSPFGSLARRLEVSSTATGSPG